MSEISASKLSLILGLSVCLVSSCAPRLSFDASLVTSEPVGCDGSAFVAAFADFGQPLHRQSGGYAASKTLGRVAKSVALTQSDQPAECFHVIPAWYPVWGQPTQRLFLGRTTESHVCADITTIEERLKSLEADLPAGTLILRDLPGLPYWRGFFSCVGRVDVESD